MCTGAQLVASLDFRFTLLPLEELESPALLYSQLDTNHHF